MKKEILHIALIIILMPLIGYSQELNIPSNYFMALNFIDQEMSDSAIIQLNLCQDDPYCVMMKADIFFKNNDFMEALALYKSVIDIMPSEAYYSIAVLYAQMGFADESTAWLEKHFEYKNPKTYSEINKNPAFENISRTSEWRKFWSEKRYSAKYEKLSEASYLINSDKSNEAIMLLQNEEFGSSNYLKFTLLSKAFFKTGNINAASTNIDIALSQNSKYSEALVVKYNIEKQKKNYQKAKETNLLLMKYDSHNPANLFNLAEVCRLNGNTDEALKYINQYLNCFPDEEAALYQKVQILSDNKDYRNALIELNKLIAVNNSVKEYFILRADIYYILESWEFASDDYSMALDIYPFLPEVYYKMGVCFFNSNDQTKACHAWQKAANMKNRDAAKMLFKFCGE
jgi:tetratricopeptide (TPR) repeat protein